MSEAASPTKQPIIFLRGDHIYLRPLEMSDADTCQRWMNDPDIWSPLGAYLPMSSERERAFITASRAKGECTQFAIALHQSNRTVGLAGLINIRWRDRVAGFDVIIGEPDCRRKGYATEAANLILNYAFTTLNLNRVELEVLASNIPAIAAYDKIGFTPEGVRRECHFINGQYVDSIIYGILSREYHHR